MNYSSKNEFHEFIINEHIKLLKHLVVFSKKTRSVQVDENQPDELYGPQYVLNIEEFLKEHMKTLVANLKNPIVNNEDIKFPLYREYKILELILNLYRATNYKNSNSKPPPNLNSQLIISNNIIKDSSELTSYVYLM